MEAKRKATLFQQLVTPRPTAALSVASKSPISSLSDVVNGRGDVAECGEPEKKREKLTPELSEEPNTVSQYNDVQDADDVTRPVMATEAAKSVTCVVNETEESSCSNSF